jgi:acetylornithine deacetylase/succinyl-diaminopimelate desuccinylase-like protein
MTRDPVEWLLALVAIPSISADPARAGDVRAAADLLAELCRTIGLRQVRLLESPGAHPSVYGERLDAPGRPTLLLYGHYDVQPVIDERAWSSPPFAPVVRDGAVYGRGASDMKGPLVSMLLALEHVLGVGHPPLNVKLLLEGEEEVFSPRLRTILQANEELLRCDMAVSADGTQPPAAAPGRVMLGTRGLCDLELIVRGARTDTHSGQYGGAVPNPAQILAELISSLHGADGAVSVAGFYDDVRTPTRAERDALAPSAWDPSAEAASLALDGFVGDPAWTPWERTTLRPTLELNAIHAGDAADRLMTAIPAMAHARISCRLVPEQRPEDVLRAIERHVRALAPPLVEVQCRRGLAQTPAYRMRADGPAAHAVASVLHELTGAPPLVTVDGGTIAALDLLRAELGVDTATLGFAGDDENAHGADEFHRVASLTRGRDAFVALLHRLAG